MRREFDVYILDDLNVEVFVCQSVCAGIAVYKRINCARSMKGCK